MRHAGWPDAGDDFEPDPVSYGTAQTYGTAHASGGYGPPPYDTVTPGAFGYGPLEPDPLAYGFAAAEPADFGDSFRGADSFRGGDPFRGGDSFRAGEPFRGGDPFRGAEPGLDAALGADVETEAEPPPGGGSGLGAGPGAGVADGYATSWEFEEGLARLLQTTPAEPVPPVTIPRQRYAHRREPRRIGHLVRRLRRLRNGPVSWLKVISLLMAALTAVIVAVVGALSGVVSYDPLRRLAAPGQADTLAAWWPLLVYGPWLVASLSILRAAVHRRRAAHSWLVVVVFSAVAVYLCVARAGHSPTRIAVAGLPPITALVCFHQLVRQITLTNPPRNGPRRPRHTVRRG